MRQHTRAPARKPGPNHKRTGTRVARHSLDDVRARHEDFAERSPFAARKLVDHFLKHGMVKAAASMSRALEGVSAEQIGRAGERRRRQLRRFVKTIRRVERLTRQRSPVCDQRPPRTGPRVRERRERRHVARSTSSSDGEPGEPHLPITFDPPPNAQARWRWVSGVVG